MILEAYQIVVQGSIAAAMFAVVGIFLKHMRRIQYDMKTERQQYLDMIGNHMKDSTQALIELTREIRDLKNNKRN